MKNMVAHFERRGSFPGWSEKRIRGGSCFISADNVAVLASLEVIAGKRWLHISVSQKGKRTPSYEVLLRAKRMFCDDDLPAYQVFPRASEYRSLKNNPALHLWQPLDGDPFPDPMLERAEQVCPAQWSEPDQPEAP